MALKTSLVAPLPQTILIGYSGHAYVVVETLLGQKKAVNAYMEVQQKTTNPYALQYLGKETEPKNLVLLKENDYFIAVGDNLRRKQISDFLKAEMQSSYHLPCVVVHWAAILAQNIKVQAGVFVAAGAVINPLATLGEGCIINTNAVVEHGCRLGEFCHIAPSTTLCGDVEVGSLSFIGANSVVKQGVRIGKNVVVGAGSVVIRDVADGERVAGSPARAI